MITISAPTPTPTSGGTMICVTVTGAGANLSASLTIGNRSFKPASIRSLGNGTWTVCFKVPTGVEGAATIKAWTLGDYQDADFVI